MRTKNARASRTSSKALALVALGVAACSPPATTPDADASTDATASEGGAPAETIAALPVARTDRLAGLAGAVDVAYDRNGWPHIYARSLRDAAFAQGYLTARDRMPQMELLRRLASGTLAEAFGPLSASLIDQDIAMRVVGLRRTAERIWSETPPGRGRTALEGYAAGVNAYLALVREGAARTPNGTELVVTDATPDWTPVDTLTVGRYQVFSFSYEANIELSTTRLRDTARETFDRATEPALAQRAGLFWDLVRFDNPSQTAVLPDFFTRAMPLQFQPDVRAPAVRRAVYERAQPFADAVERAQSYLGETGFRGSNNWVLPASSSGTGHALLANDPHLALTAPAVWYGLHLTVTEGPDAVDVAGVSFPGLPGVLIGFSRKVAWGATVAYYDVTDVYEETVTPGVGGAPDTVRFNGMQVPLQRLVERVDDGSGNTIEVPLEVVPHHGPIVPTIRNGRVEPRTGTTALSVRWTGHQPTRELDAFVGAMYAQTAAEARAAFTQHYGVGAMNWVFADVEGNALYGAPAVVPERAMGARSWDPTNRIDGTLPCLVLPGTGEAEWVGSVAPTRLPNGAASPMRPFIATANNDQTGSTLDGNPVNDPLYLNCQYTPGFRAERVTERLRALGTRVTREQLEALQGDVHILYAARWRPFLQRAFAALEAEWERAGARPDLSALATTLRPRQARLRDAMARLMAWSLEGASGVREGATETERRDAVATTIFHGWSVRMAQRTYGDELEAMRYSASSWSGDAYRSALTLLEHPERARTRDATRNESVVFDDLRTTDARESADYAIVAALDDALTQLATVTRSEDMSTWLWGNLHTVRFDSVVPGPGAVLSIPPRNDPNFPNGFPRPGGLEVVDASHPGLSDFNFSFASGASTRFTVDMNPAGPEAYMVLPGGAAFDTRSPHHRDGAELWRTNRTHRVFLLERDVAQNAARRVRLEPGS